MIDAALARILIVDDEPSVRSAIGDYLSREGFEVLEAGDGAAMRRILAEQVVGIVLLDVMLPGEGGLSLARWLADHRNVGVIMISARGSEADRIAGLEFGADDYLPKPVSPRELLARIRALQRRFKGASAPGGLWFEFAGWQLDAVRRVLRDPAGVVTSLSDGEFSVLLAFVEHPQRVLSRDELLNLARGRESDSFDRAIDTQVSRIRQKLRGAAGEEVIKTLRGEGYMFLPPVTMAAARDGALAKPAPGPEPVAVPGSRIRLDPRACQASVAGRSLDLTFAEFSLLTLLVEAGGQVIEKDALSRQVLGRPWRSFDRSVDVHVSKLRNKLAPFPDIAIETVRRVGYRLVDGQV